MTLYRRKPKPVEAFKWQPDNVTMDGRYPVPEWVPEYDVNDGLLRIFTPARTLYVLANEWVMKEGERIMSCKPEVFEEEYEPLEG